MNVEDARGALSSAADEDEPAELTHAVLSKLTIDDVPEGAMFRVGTLKNGVFHLDWDGTFHRVGGGISAVADHTWTRKYWYSPLGLEQYLDLTRRVVETRERVTGDVELLDYDDDGAYVSLQFGIDTTETNLARVYDSALKVEAQILEAANQAADEVGKRIAEIAARLSGWGSESLDRLADAVEIAVSTDDKGRTLEELCSRLFSSVAGLTVTGRIRTETEEIDISVLNDSVDPRLRREGAVFLAECKNWTGKCGKNEFVLFHQKIENRNQRCSLGFLISWNGFAETVTKEMLRGSREGILVVPLTGEDIRQAVRTDDFLNVLLKAWDMAVNI
jgi:hypothetical protein